MSPFPKPNPKNCNPWPPGVCMVVGPHVPGNSFELTKSYQHVGWPNSLLEYCRKDKENYPPVFLEMIDNLDTLSGGDERESQLVAIYQIATGAGQVVDLEPYGNTGTFEIPAGQGISFRDDAIKIMYVGH